MTSQPRQLAVVHPIANASWAGRCPWLPGICYGTYDGELVLPDGKRFPVASEPVNAAAFDGDRVVVTTRESIHLLKHHDGSLINIPHNYEAGAHGVVSTGSESFLCPVGPAGFLLIDGKGLHPIQGTRVQTPYKVAKIDVKSEHPLFCYAGLRTGFGSIFLDGVENPISGFEGPELNFIDVAPFSEKGSLEAVLALSVEGYLVICPAIRQPDHATLRVSKIQFAKPSALAVSSGMVFVLDEKGLHILPDGVRVNHLTHPSPQRLLFSPFQADDMFSDGDDGVLFLRQTDIIELPSVNIRSMQAGSTWNLTPDWAVRIQSTEANQLSERYDHKSFSLAG